MHTSVKTEIDTKVEEAVNLTVKNCIKKLVELGHNDAAKALSDELLEKD